MTDLRNEAATPARTGDDRYVVLPFYLLCDVSGSMSPHIATLNTSLREFRDTLAKDPVLSDKVQFGVVDFSDDASEVVPLGDFTAADLDSRQLSSRGGTSYAAAFRTMRQTMERDIAAGSDRYKYFRPAVFFLTDGYPNGGDGWEQAFAALTEFDPVSGQGFKSYPLFVPFGIGDADATILRQLVHPQHRSALFMANAGATPTAAIQAMTKGMLASVLKSGRSVPTGRPQHVLPTQADVGTAVTVYPGGDFVS
jgi:uncharacterized protein YegL